jgi:thiol-disulfide isomerase/thioredoxin
MNAADRSTRRIAGRTLFMMAALLAGAASGLSAQTRIGIEVGATPEPLVLPTVEGEKTDLADSFGHRPVLLQFWATWCPKCEALEPQIIAAHEQFGDRVDFYGVAVAVGQSPDRIVKHFKDRPLPFPMLWDEQGEATRRFMAPTTSYVVILDSDGRVAYTGVDTEQDIIGALRRVAGSQSASTEPASP